jgi:hypothetical protein
MRILLIPVLGLTLACAFAGPTSSIAAAATYGTSATKHTMKPKTVAYTSHSKVCHSTKTHSCKPARKAHKHATTY